MQLYKVYLGTYPGVGAFHSLCQNSYMGTYPGRYGTTFANYSTAVIACTLVTDITYHLPIAILLKRYQILMILAQEMSFHDLAFMRYDPVSRHKYTA